MPARPTQVVPSLPLAQMNSKRLISSLVHKKMGKVLPILPETAPQQSQPFQPREYSNERPQPALEFVLQAQEPQSPDKMANEGTTDVGSSCSHGSDIPQHILSVVVVNPEPAISLWAQFFYHTHQPSNKHSPLFEMAANQCD